MRPFVLLALALLMPVASASTVSVSLVAHDDGFSLSGATERNPTIFIPPGSHVVLSLENQASTAQSLSIGDPIDRGTPCCLRPGDITTLEFDVDANVTGQISYWSPEAPQTLAGVLQVQQVPATIHLLAPVDGATVGALVEARAAVDGAPSPARVAWALDGANVTNATTDLTHAFDISEGHHLLHVELLGQNDTYLSPRVFAEAVVFRGRDALTTPSDANGTSTTPPTAPSKTPGVGLLALVACAAGIAIALPSRRRR